MLEPGGVGGVAGDGDIHLLHLHDGDALQHIVGAVAPDLGTLPVGELHLPDHLQVAGGEVIVGLHVGEAVDAGDDVSGILAQAVEDDAQRLLAGLVGVAGDADGPLGGGEGFVAGQEAEALGLIPEEHRPQVAVAQAHLALLGDGTGDAEGLEPLADDLGGVGGLGAALLQRQGDTQGVGPDGVLKGDGLHALDDLLYIDALLGAKVPGILQGLEAVFREAGLDLRHPSLLSFKLCHVCSLLSLSKIWPYSSRGSTYLGASAKRP